MRVKQQHIPLLLPPQIVIAQQDELFLQTHFSLRSACPNTPYTELSCSLHFLLIQHTHLTQSSVHYPIDLLLVAVLLPPHLGSPLSASGLLA